MSRTSRLAAALGVFVLVLALYHPPAPLAQPGAPDVGQKAPDFKLEPIGGGRPFSLSQFKGKPVVLVFWATWCGPCRREIPALKELYQTYTQKGVQVVTVTIEYRQTREQVVQFQQTNQLPYIVLWDAQNKVSDAWGVEGIPTNLVVDAKGVIRFRGNALDGELVGALDAALQASKG